MRVLLLDTETSPNTGYVWGLFDQTISLSQLIDTSGLLCWSAKWLGEESGYFSSIYKHPKKKMLKGIHDLMSEADVVVTYNGNRFDIPVLNKEFLLAGMMPPPPYKSVDVYQTIKRRFRFASNKMDHISEQLGLGQKHKTDFKLWIDCMNKDAAAWEKMEAYNIQDTILLEKIYLKTLPWMRTHPNRSVYSETACCTNCGSKNYQARGTAVTLARKYVRFQCKDCGTWFRGPDNIAYTKGQMRQIYVG
jgi:DNA polymerase elongation subunit (family B)